MKELLYADPISFAQRNLVAIGESNLPPFCLDEEHTKKQAYTILPDGRARFAFYYPNASRVTVNRMAKTAVELRREGDYFVGEAEFNPGFIPLTVEVDGSEIIDGMLPIGFGASRVTNYIEVPEPGEDGIFYEIPDCPHGTVAVNYIHSKTTGRTERVLVYLPACYEESEDTRFPVLYLQHGHGENEGCWTYQGKMNFILDRLISEGKASPMIVCMANGMIPEEQDGITTINRHKMSELWINELIPYIEGKYRTYGDKEHRAVAGLSMGSMQTSIVSFTHSELFTYVGLFSGFMRDISSNGDSHLTKENILNFNKNIKVFFRAIGESDHLKKSFDEDDVIVKERDIPCIRKLYEGGHEWKVWRHCLYDFAQLLWK